MQSYLEKQYKGNCAEFVRDVLRDKAGKELRLPQFESGLLDGPVSEQELMIDRYRYQTARVRSPENYDIALMVTAEGLPTHIGVYFDGMIYHVVNKQGFVSATPVSRLGRLSLKLHSWYRAS